MTDVIITVIWDDKKIIGVQDVSTGKIFSRKNTIDAVASGLAQWLEENFYNDFLTAYDDNLYACRTDMDGKKFIDGSCGVLHLRRLAKKMGIKIECDFPDWDTRQNCPGTKFKISKTTA